MATIAQLLDGAEDGDENAAAALAPLVYDELRRLAHRT
ncbi:MAG TPA: ECF-type sigma factor [Vicinamibacteria bacterium]